MTAEELYDLTDNFKTNCQENLNKRTAHLEEFDNSDENILSVSSSLIGRQCALVMKFSSAPEMWDFDIAPIILRTMIEGYITLRWIADDPSTRSAEFISYGLGQAKLRLSHFEAVDVQDEEDERLESVIEITKQWIQSQAWLPLVEINLGSWHGSSVRKMCQDINDDDLYKFAYFPFCSCTHNSWDHVSVYNANRCKNPMHKFHYVGAAKGPIVIFDMLVNAAKYYSRSLVAFDSLHRLQFDEISPLEFLENSLAAHS